MFKSWLVSNIEIFLGILLAILSYFLFKQLDADFDADFAVQFTGLAVFVYLAVCGFASMAFSGTLIFGLIGLAIPVVAIMFATDSPEYTGAASIVTVGSIIGYVVSIIVAVFSYKNFYDIVDSRWLFRTSDKDIFAEQWKYALNRFCVTIGFFDVLALGYFFISLISL